MDLWSAPWLWGWLLAPPCICTDDRAVLFMDGVGFVEIRFADTSHGGRSETHGGLPVTLDLISMRCIWRTWANSLNICMRAGEGNDHDGWTCSLLFMYLFRREQEHHYMVKIYFQSIGDIPISCFLLGKSEDKTMLKTKNKEHLVMSELMMWEIRDNLKTHRGLGAGCRSYDTCIAGLWRLTTRLSWLILILVLSWRALPSCGGGVGVHGVWLQGSN